MRTLLPVLEDSGPVSGLASGSAEGCDTSLRAGPLWRPSLIVALAAVFVALILITPWPLDSPLSWSGDTFQHAALARSANWMGGPGTLSNMGAPAGVDWSSLPTGGERLHLVVLGGITSITGNVWFAANVHLLIVLALTAVCAFLVIRWMGVSELLAGAAGLVFAFLPAVYNHIAYGHPFLVGLYPVPLAVYLMVRWSGRAPECQSIGSRSSGGETGTASAGWLGRFGPSVCAVLLIGMSSTYYAAFAAILSVLFGIVIAVRRLQWRAAIPNLATAAAIFSVLLVSSAPELLRPSVAADIQRKLSDATRFALKPLELLLPQEGHPLRLLSGWGAGSDVALGLVAATGVLLLVFHVIRKLGRERDETDRWLTSLATMAVLGLAVGTNGGVGWLIARAGFRDLRVWSRMSVFVGFCGIAAVAVVGQRSMARWAADPKTGGRMARLAWSRPVILVALVVVLALLDQRAALPSPAAVRADMQEDVALVREMSRSLPPGSLVLEWPVIAFPDDFGSDRLLAPALLGDNLRFSAGVFRGGPSDWQQSWALEEVPDQLNAAAAAGFDALLVQVDHHLWEDPDVLLGEVRSTLGPPEGTSANGTWQWFDLRGLQEHQRAEFSYQQLETFASQMFRPVGVTVAGTPGFPSTGSERDAVLGPSGAVELTSYDDDASSLLVAFEVAAASGSKVSIESGGKVLTLTPGSDGQDVVVPVRLSHGRGDARITVDGKPLGNEVGTTPVFAEIRYLQVFDAGLADSPVVVPAALR